MYCFIGPGQSSDPRGGGPSLLIAKLKALMEPLRVSGERAGGARVGTSADGRTRHYSLSASLRLEPPGGLENVGASEITSEINRCVRFCKIQNKTQYHTEFSLSSGMKLISSNKTESQVGWAPVKEIVTFRAIRRPRPRPPAATSQPVIGIAPDLNNVFACVCREWVKRLDDVVESSACER
ncbi:hypothetical protein EVAR_80916_1 [Eumeta japonica]|uniref:Uncharacterized protein n=1 Tax=Eumeta variegata TaxID=151549 RepID=A0A4C1V0X2_EUMVA|nr:hypothetical protein EVAR_80916_1 [Eumeta japonica]